MEFAKKVIRYIFGHNEDENCPVCFEVMTNCWITSRRVTLKPCRHQFCQRCVKIIWRGLTYDERFRCPLCRQNAEFKFNLAYIFTMTDEEDLGLLLLPWIICFLLLLMITMIFVLLVIIWINIFAIFWERFRRIVAN